MGPIPPYSEMNLSSSALHFPEILYQRMVFKLRVKTLNDLASRFNLTYRYIDDELSINNPEFENYLGKMYPAELEIKETTETAPLLLLT